MHHTHIYVGCDQELNGKSGTLYTASGHYDPNSIKAGAFIFETDEVKDADGENVGCYCDRDDVRLYHGPQAEAA